jgi:hypothetical protein
MKTGFGTWSGNLPGAGAISHRFNQAGHSVRRSQFDADCQCSGSKETVMTGELFQDRDAPWRKLLELQCQREIVERWLHTTGVPEQLQEQLQFMLHDIALELSALEMAEPPASASPMRQAS